jgi:Skp family chaperone for outer membrane proteins
MIKLNRLAFAAALLAGATGVTGVAAAQTKIYYINEALVRQQTKVGKEMNAVLNQIASQRAQTAGLEALQKQLRDERTALQPQVESLSDAAIQSNPQLKSRLEAFGAKQQDLQQKSGAISAEIQQRSQQLNAMFTYVLDPAISHVAKTVNADVVLNDPDVRYIKDTVDITSKVVARLDATIPTIQALQAAMPQPPAGSTPAPATNPSATAPKPQGQ